MVDGIFGGLIFILQGLLQVYRIYKLPSRIIKLINLSIKIYNFISNYKNIVVYSLILLTSVGLVYCIGGYSCTEYICCNITECDAPRA